MFVLEAFRFDRKFIAGFINLWRIILGFLFCAQIISFIKGDYSLLDFIPGTIMIVIMFCAVTALINKAILGPCNEIKNMEQIECVEEILNDKYITTNRSNRHTHNRYYVDAGEFTQLDVINSKNYYDMERGDNIIIINLKTGMYCFKYIPYWRTNNYFSLKAVYQSNEDVWQSK